MVCQCNENKKFMVNFVISDHLSKNIYFVLYYLKTKTQKIPEKHLETQAFHTITNSDGLYYRYCALEAENSAI